MIGANENELQLENVSNEYLVQITFPRGVAVVTVKALRDREVVLSCEGDDLSPNS